MKVALGKGGGFCGQMPADEGDLLCVGGVVGYYLLAPTRVQLFEDMGCLRKVKGHDLRPFGGDGSLSCYRHTAGQHDPS